MKVRNNAKRAVKLGMKIIQNQTNSVPKRKKPNQKIQNFMKKQKRGVVYLSHIPHGFYENQIKAYFGQFGEVTTVNVPRGKTGRARGFAFVEFKHPDVAKIAAETMDSYLMFNRVLKARYVAPKDQKPYIFKYIQSEAFKSLKEKYVENIEMNRSLKNTTFKEGKEDKRIKIFKAKKRKTEEKLINMGISYNWEVNFN